MNRRPPADRPSRLHPPPLVAGWIELLEARALMAAPVVEPIAEVGLPSIKTLFVPVRGSDPDGDPLSYSIASSNPDVQVSIRAGRPFLRLEVAGFGDMVFQLFDDLAPDTVEKIGDLAEADFYDGLTFHRVVRDFVIQGGDPQGDGTGGPGFTFPDEFHPDAIFTGTGQLAMANTGKDTNGSQFFVTVGPQRHLDFNHTIFGQLVRGQDVLTAINQVPTGGNNQPVTPVVITDASIEANTTDTVLLVRAPAGSGNSTITVTASDPDGSTSSRSFTAQFTPDPPTLNDPPILGPVGNQTAVLGLRLSIPLTSTDLEGDPVEYSASILNDPSAASVVVEGSTVTVSPTPGSSGSFSLRVGVKQRGEADRGSPGSDPNDFQTIVVGVVPLRISPTGVPLSAVAGVAATGVVASFTANGGAATEFNATISFGDGIPVAGTIVANDRGGFDVLGTHTFASAGEVPIGVTITGPGDVSVAATTRATVALPARTRLTIGLVESTDPVVIGQDLTYTVTVTNAGNATALGLILTFLVPTGVTFVSSTIEPISMAGMLATIPLGELPGGESRSLQISVRPAAGGTIASTAHVASSAVPTLTASRSEMTVVQATPNPPLFSSTTGPQVIDVSRRGSPTGRSLIDLTFGSALDPARAEDLRNFVLVAAGRDGRLGTRDDIRVPIAKASYDAATRSVTLALRSRLNRLRLARLQVRSGEATGLTDIGGRALDGDRDGVPGGAFVARFGRAGRRVLRS